MNDTIDVIIWKLIQNGEYDNKNSHRVAKYWLGLSIDKMEKYKLEISELNNENPDIDKFAAFLDGELDGHGDGDPPLYIEELECGESYMEFVKQSGDPQLADLFCKCSRLIEMRIDERLQGSMKGKFGLDYIMEFARFSDPELFNFYHQSMNELGIIINDAQQNVS